MKRRQFVRSVSGGLASIPFLGGTVSAHPAIEKAVNKAAQRLDSLASDLAGIADDADFWQRVRREFQQDEGLVHLNCGSLGSTPTFINDAVAAFSTEIEKNPVPQVFNWGGAEMETVRSKAAEFMGCSLEEIAFVRNTTEAMTAVATGLDLEPGDQVLTSNHEHGGGMVCWQYLRKHRGIDVRYVHLPRRGLTKQKVLDLIQEGITARTRVCSFSHIDTITGFKMPVAEIADMLRKRNILFVCDGAQAPGMVQVNVGSLKVDAYACSGHKWILAPKGTGLLYIRKEVQDQIHPAFLYSGYGSYTASAGTRGVDRILGFGLTLEFHRIIGREKIESRCRQLQEILAAQLAGIPELQLLTPESSDLSAGMLTYSLMRGNNSVVRERMDQEYRIQIKSAQGTYAYCEEDTVEPENYNAIRFSTHIYNDEAEIDSAVIALKNVLKTL